MNDERFTISAKASGELPFAIHDHRDFWKPGRVVARCDTMPDALKVQRALNREYALSMQVGPAQLRQKRTAKQ